MSKIKDLRKSGIYKISFTGSDRFYIGSAVNLTNRKSVHLCELKKRNHCNGIMQKVFDKYGIENFRFEVVELVGVDGLIEREQFWIDQLTPDINILKIANSSLGFKHSDDTLQKLRVINKQNAIRPDVLAKTSATQFKKGMKWANEQRENQKNRMLINNPYKGKKHTEFAKKAMSEAAKRRDRSNIDFTSFVLAGREASKKPIVQLDASGNVVREFPSVTAAMVQFGTKQSRHLISACKSDYAIYKGYRWAFA